MAEPLMLLQSRRDDWLVGLDSQKLLDLAETRYQILCQRSQKYPVVLIAEADPLEFLASFIAACTARCPVFLGNPHWTEMEWQQVFRQVRPDVIWGGSKTKYSVLDAFLSMSPGWIMIPTGGSSGKVRFVIHTWETLLASVVGFQEYFQVDQVNSCCVLPLYHVSGLMQFLRSLFTNGNLVISNYKDLSHNNDLSLGNYFLSLVPTQLQKIIANPVLSDFQTILLGGAPAWPQLLDTARQQHLRLAPTYGMTETASQVVTLKPDDFLQGKTGCGQVLPHAQVRIGEPDGRIEIQARSLALGYYGDRMFDGVFQTDDLGFFDAEGYLHLVGRDSQKIITGGENVFPVEVESAIWASGLVKDVYVLGMPDEEWGEVITAVYVPGSGITAEMILERIRPALSRYKLPKRWVAVADLPRNAQGKVSVQAARDMLRGCLKSSRIFPPASTRSC
jgi:o-succinylbenzoate---CoA ligase